MQIVHLLLDRILTAARTPVTTAGWLKTTGWVGLYGAVALPFGWLTQSLQWQPLSEGLQILRVAVVAFFLPALSEELLFRVCWLPRQGATRSQLWFWGGTGLALYVLAHPLTALLVLPGHRQTFFDPNFLVLTALLGVACTGVYLQTRSLWPPVIIHWLVVAVWLVGLGGYDRLHAAL
ncbi:MAG: type II CAAX prenyl endopeptidase Rce1 family protein [Leptolyngbyaceae cyanobacterium]